jgi:L-ribulokinase
MFGAVAAGEAAGGFSNICDCATAIGKTGNTYYPIESNSNVYDKLYGEYLKLHDYFGRGGNEAMKTLKKIKEEA